MGLRLLDSIIFAFKNQKLKWKAITIIGALNGKTIIFNSAYMNKNATSEIFYPRSDPVQAVNII